MRHYYLAMTAAGGVAFLILGVWPLAILSWIVGISAWLLLR